MECRFRVGWRVSQTQTCADEHAKKRGPLTALLLVFNLFGDALGEKKKEITNRLLPVSIYKFTALGERPPLALL